MFASLGWSLEGSTPVKTGGKKRGADGDGEGAETPTPVKKPRASKKKAASEDGETPTKKPTTPRKKKDKVSPKTSDDEEPGVKEEQVDDEV